MRDQISVTSFPRLIQRPPRLTEPPQPIEVRRLTASTLDIRIVRLKRFGIFTERHALPVDSEGSAVGEDLPALESASAAYTPGAVSTKSSSPPR